MKIKKWIPVRGEKFYFIYPISNDRVEIDKDDLSMNHPEYFLTIGDAECCSPKVDTISNCFRTKKQAKNALKKIKDALKFTGNIM